MKDTRLFFALIVLLSSLVACNKDKEEDMNPPEDINTEIGVAQSEYCEAANIVLDLQVDGEDRNAECGIGSLITYNVDSTTAHIVSFTSFEYTAKEDGILLGNAILFGAAELRMGRNMFGDNGSYMVYYAGNYLDLLNVNYEDLENYFVLEPEEATDTDFIEITAESDSQVTGNINATLYESNGSGNTKTIKGRFIANTP